MKVLAVCSSELGGAELSLLEFVLHRPSHTEVEVLLLGEGPLRDALAQRGIPTTLAVPDLAKRPTLASAARFSGYLRALLKREDPDVVWAVGVKAAALAVPACRLSRTPLVWHKVDFSHDAWLTPPLGLASNGVVSVSSAVAAPLRRVRARRLLSVIGVPIRLPVTARVAPNERQPTIGTLAALRPYKGHHLILEAAALLSGEFPDLRVLLGGGASPAYPHYPRELEALAQRVGLAERVELLGFIDDVTAVLDRLTVFVNATHRDEQGFGLEGLGASAIEASWVGLPVVAIDGGGIREAVRDGVTGTVAPLADARALAKAIAPYLRDPELARTTGEAGRRFARQRFSPEVTSQRLFDALARAAGGASSP